MLKVVKQTQVIEADSWEGTQLDLLRMVGSLDEALRDRKLDDSVMRKIRQKVMEEEKKRAQLNKELLLSSSIKHNTQES
ncbi:hypothetical protein BCU85_20725 [Vibrio lentus]|uniref:hypothetical protein n=1 Tax=Vibrio lentus TaxID=136468 RepID=UPI000C86698D|nr:hypothetical protein [Vibrio lentus]MCC4819346.1 hypothetical protein [Vibrio lentus]PMG72013.1 hypothetical protein BCU85_20725 [Vibrio lentus]PMK86327.1 hypothetical protein BCT88_12065 [Vibrio lentus]PML21297.1 hypothetical protein BCT80_15710 [Vibrio lentus]PMM24009.1 hypothetical protein BCT57_08425 [Vibrio lentus]